MQFSKTSKTVVQNSRKTDYSL